MIFWHGIPLGVDFRGGTIVYVKFAHAPDDDAIRGAMDRAGLRDAKIQRFGEPRAITKCCSSLSQKETSEAALDQGKTRSEALEQPTSPADKKDLNNASALNLTDFLMKKDPLHAGTDATQRYAALAQAIVNYRDKTNGGVLTSLDQLKSERRSGGAGGAAGRVLLLSNFGVRNVISSGRRSASNCRTRPSGRSCIRWPAC